MVENGMNEPGEMSDVTFEELIELENDHNDVDIETMRTQWKLSQPLFARRKNLVPRIPHFWPIVFDEGPPEITSFIQPSDARFFADHLINFEAERFELDSEPRSFSLKFEFSANPHFEETILEKKFYWRRSVDGWSGIISEPVSIKWKAGKDLTNGLTDAACNLWTAFEKSDGLEKRAGFTDLQGDKSYKALKNKLDESDFSMHSFFTLFTYVSSYRYVSAKESKEASEKEAADRAAKKAGKTVEETESPENDIDDTEVISCPNGDDLATLLIEEVYANAVKYFTSAHERDSEALSEADFEEDDLDSDDGSAPSLVDANDAPGKRKADFGDSKQSKKSK